MRSANILFRLANRMLALLEENMEIRAAKESEFDEIIDLLCTVFIEKCRPRYTSQIYSDSSYQLHQSRVCIVDGKIVSHIRVSDRAIHIGRSVVKLGGIGMVGTLPEYRRLGYATAVMQDAIAYMEEQGYDLSLLFTSIQPFYMQFGWAPFPQTTFVLELHDTSFAVSSSICSGGLSPANGLSPAKLSPVPSSWISRQFDPKRDLTQIIQIYDEPLAEVVGERSEHNKQRSGTIVRSEQHWRDGYSHQVGILPSLVVEKDGIIGAYANLGFGTTYPDSNVADAFLATYYPNVREVGYRSQYPDSLLALCHAILRKAYEKDVASISGRLPRHHPLTELLSEESGSTLSFSITEGLMYRVISLHSLFQKMIPEFEARLENSAMTEKSGSFCFIVANQICTLNINLGKVVVTDDDRGQTKVHLDTRRFLKVLLGDATFGQLNELNRVKGLILRPDEIALLSVLFPKGEPIHWVCDYF